MYNSALIHEVSLRALGEVLEAVGGKDSGRGLFLCGYCKEGMLSLLLSRDLLQQNTHTPVTPHLCSTREQLISLSRSFGGIPPQFVTGTSGGVVDIVYIHCTGQLASNSQKGGSYYVQLTLVHFNEVGDELSNPGSKTF